MSTFGLTCEEVRDLVPLFVVGALQVDEMDAVRRHAGACPDAHEEILEMSEAATALLETVAPVEPRPDLRVRLLAAAAADLAEGRHPAGVPAAARAAIPAAAPVVRSARPVPPASAGPVPILVADVRRRVPGPAWLLAAAAVIVAVALGGWNLGLQRDLGSAEAYRDGVGQVIDLAARPGSLTAVLAGSDGAVSGLGAVGADGSVRLVLRGLAGTGGSQVYTVWSIIGDAAPAPIGEFTVGADGVALAMARTTAAVPGTTLALTLEPRPGSTAPTLPIVAAGVAGAPGQA